MASTRQLASSCPWRSFEPGTMLLRGDQVDPLYVLLWGDVSVAVDLATGGQRRLSSLSAGMSFGEQALLAGGICAAHVLADPPVICCTLTAGAFADLERECPAVALRLLRNLLLVSAQTVGRLTANVWRPSTADGPTAPCRLARQRRSGRTRGPEARGRGFDGGQ
jgi:glutaminase